MADVVTIKLVGGEEILGRVIMEGDIISIEKPRVLHIAQVNAGQLGMTLIPWVASNPDCIARISLKDVVTMVGPKEDIIDAYMKQTSEVDLSAVSSKKILVG